MPGSRRRLPTLGGPLGALSTHLPPSVPSFASPQRGPRVSPSLLPASGCIGESCSESGDAKSLPSKPSTAPDQKVLKARTSVQSNQTEESKLQHKKDLRVAAEWNEVFKSAANRRDPEKLSNFWTELKLRLVKKFGTLPAAFVSLDINGDNVLNFPKFSDMLRLMYLPLDQRISRLLFERAAGGDLKLSPEELKRMLLERNVQRIRTTLQVYNEKGCRIQLHIQRLLGRLAQADEAVCSQGVDRFQRKLTVTMCRELWNVLLDRLSSSGHRNISVSRTVFKEVVCKVFVGKYLQAYECPYMMAIFDRTDTFAGRKPPRGSIKLTVLMCALMLLSTESERCLKISLLFEAFDCDEDGCLLYDQILAMLQCMCAQRILADESCRGATWCFQERLASQEGLQHYKRVQWCLQEELKVEGDVVALSELWEALERQVMTLEDVLPSMVRMRWLMEHLQEAERGPVHLAVRQSSHRTKSTAGPQPPGSAQRLRQQSVCSSSPPGSAPYLDQTSAPGIGSLDLPGHSLKGLQDRRVAWHQPGRKSGESQRLSSAASKRGSRSNRASMLMTQGIKSNLNWKEEHQGLEPIRPSAQLDALACGSLHPPFGGQAGAEHVPEVPRKAGGAIRSALSSGGSSRRCRVRISAQPELEPWSLHGGAEADPGGEKRDLIPDFQLRSPQSAARALQVAPLTLEHPRPSSADSDMQLSKGLPRSKSAPAEQGGTGFAVPNIDLERWGTASTERFRLFCAVKSFGRDAVPDRQQSSDVETAGIAFRCALCNSNHTMSAGCDI